MCLPWRFGDLHGRTPFPLSSFRTNSKNTISSNNKTTKLIINQMDKINRKLCKGMSNVRVRLRPFRFLFIFASFFTREWMFTPLRWLGLSRWWVLLCFTILVSYIGNVRVYRCTSDVANVNNSQSVFETSETSFATAVLLLLICCILFSWHVPDKECLIVTTKEPKVSMNSWFYVCYQYICAYRIQQTDSISHHPDWIDAQ